MKKLDQATISEFANEQDISQLTSSYNQIYEIIESAIETVASKNKLLIPLDKVELYPINSFANSSNTTVSELDFLLTIESPQLELNSQSLILSKWQKFKKDFSMAWRNRNTKRNKKKKRKLQKHNIGENYYENVPYNIMRVKSDIFEEIVNNVSNLTIVANKQNYLRIVANQEFGLTFNLYIAIKSDNLIKFWIPQRNEFNILNLKELGEFVSKKTSIIGANYLASFRIFNNLYYYIYKTQPPMLLIEYILSCIPDTLFKNNNQFDSFCQVINYLINNKGVLIDNNEFLETYAKTDYYKNTLKTQTIQFIKNLSKVL